MDQIVVFVLIGIFLWLVLLSLYIYQTSVQYKRLVIGATKESLSDILNKILNTTDIQKREIDEVKKVLFELGKEGMTHIQKVGIVRFNPFADTGGDQSFVLAILDGLETGIVLTSLHNRGVTRWYVKNVKEGKGIHHELSEEEILAIREASQMKKSRTSGNPTGKREKD